MQILSGLATLAFVVVGALVGIRLLFLARRTRKLPEASVGLALLLIGGIGYPMAIAAGTPGLVAASTGLDLMVVSTFVIDFGFIAVVVFTWSAFRPQEGWARALLGFLSLSYVAHAISIGISSASMTSPADVMSSALPATLAGQMLNSLAFGWTAIEAYRYWWMLRKRVAIGLSDPIVVNRFLLWAIAATCSLLTNAISWWVVFQGIDFFASTGVQAAIGVLSVSSCTAQYLAFLPPKRYLARFRTSDAAGA